MHLLDKARESLQNPLVNHDGRDQPTPPFDLRVPIAPTAEKLLILLPARRRLSPRGRLRRGDLYIGRGVPQKGLRPSKWMNPFRLHAF